MSITRILSDKEKSNDEKLSAVAEVIAGAREKYGNSDIDIPVPNVNSTNGMIPFNMMFTQPS